VRTRVYDGPQLVFTGELDASSSGPEGYEIAKLNANARLVVFRNGWHAHFLPIRREGWIPVALTRGCCAWCDSRCL
jgi:hypothetical protein